VMYLLTTFVGLLATAVRTIQENVERIPNKDSRTLVSIIAFDTSLHFFAVPPVSPCTPFLLAIVSCFL
jgi:protein transport protein SEC24